MCPDPFLLRGHSEGGFVRIAVKCDLVACLYDLLHFVGERLD